MIRKIAKWRYGHNRTIDCAETNIAVLRGDGLSISLYHSDGEYVLNLSPTFVDMSDTGFISERGNPMEGFRISFLRKRFNQSTANRLYGAIANIIPEIGKYFEQDDRENILESVRSISIK